MRPAVKYVANALANPNRQRAACEFDAPSGADQPQRAQRWCTGAFRRSFAMHEAVPGV